MGKKIDLTKQRFGRLLVLKESTLKDRFIYWECLCDCGKQVIVRGSRLRLGNTQSCGCYRYERVKQAKLRHGHTINNITTPEYQAWIAMKDRCLNKKNKKYADYGGRGIKVCDNWLNSFENFLEDMGEKPTSKHSLDRINNDGDYCAINCRWATLEQQNGNRRNCRKVVVEGNSLSLREACKLLTLNYFCIRNSIYNMGISADEAVLRGLNKAGFKG